MSKHTPQQLQPEADHRFHIPVLLDKVVELLAPQSGETYLDLTAGYGGHAQAIANRTGDHKALTLVDRDDNAIKQLQSFEQKGARVVHDDFVHFAQAAVASGDKYDMVLVDFGVSSPQLDRAERGFSILRDGPLDMRMDNRQSKSAFDVVNHTREQELVKILREYGEERPSNAVRVAKAIVRARPLHTTKELADAILSTHRGPYQKIHPATRTFQAIRIAVNDELQQISKLLHIVDNLLQPHGRIAFISFHSLEDRLVKQYLSDEVKAGYEASLQLITKKAILGKIYDVHNPRARSASLRAAVKNKKKG